MSSNDIKYLSLSVQHHGTPLDISLPESSSIVELSDYIAEHLLVPVSNQKFLIAPKVGLLKPPFSDRVSIASLLGKKIILMGSTATEVAQLQQSISRGASLVNRHATSVIKPAVPARTRDINRIRDEAMYTFHTIKPLPYLPNPQKSHDFLVRLREDPGIKAAMRKFKFTVALLTEMDPAMHTTHESKTLGLNRNKGEVIELRLRTDAYDGYRDYKTIRKTLCHELAHNVHSNHDRNFHNLWNDIEKLVQKEDWSRGGSTLANEVFYEPAEQDSQHFDAGGWTGGEYVLGRATDAASTTGLSRREILARAVESRSKVKDSEDDLNSPANSRSGPSNS